MGDRHKQFITYLAQLKRNALRLTPAWAFWSLLANGFFLGAIFYSLMREAQINVAPATYASTPSRTPTPASTAPPAALGNRLYLSYQEWVDLLREEANVAAYRQPTNLTILLGDSISQWFPPNLLLGDRTWLNQGLSGETSAGLLRRLSLLDKTRPQTILVMIGINDLLRGISDEEILNNYQEIVRYLRTTHPNTQIVVQSILPHGDVKASWEGRDRLLLVPNSRIRTLNQRIAEISIANGASFFDLYSLFADLQGNLRMDLSTDGLHLNPDGYLVWQTGLRLYLQVRG
jgi:lysophospholipase L1-like esterase